MRKLLFLALIVMSFINYGQNTIYLHCGKLVDIESGKILTEKTVVVSGNKIISIKNGYIASKSMLDQIIDLKNKTVMPGLIDFHVHIEGENNPQTYLQRYTLNEADVAFNSIAYARATLMAGFTTVRDLGGSGVNIALRNAIAAGKIDGPRIFTAGKALGTTGGHADPTNGYRNIMSPIFRTAI